MSSSQSSDINSPGAYLLVSAQEKKTIKDTIDHHITNLKNEQNYQLQQKTIARLERFMQNIHTSRYDLKVFAKKILRKHVDMNTANEKLTELWANYLADSEALKHPVYTAPASYFPRAAAPIPIPPAASASYTSPDASYHHSSASSGSGHLSYGSSHRNPQPFPGPNYGPQPASVESNAAFYQNQGISYPHGPPPYNSTGGPVPSYDNSPSSRASRGSSRSGYYQMQGGEPPQTMSMPGPAHTQGPNAQPYAYGAYAPGYGPAPSTGPGYAPGPGYGSSAPAAYGHYQPNPGPSSGPYQ
ncbi:hypothetical protein B0H11DRAFT_2014752 [Mycena galericulata]|nr:hypothetical protein B0H11DRAFT_2077448 [Mycena galericulata]KAJ7487208.1 hypothetical protein B0H11DRAFT_2014752 [Mycena galericulata]